jgi:hypothetical protein
MAERRFEAALARLLAESAAEGLDEAQIREVFERLLRARSIQQEGAR